MLFAPWTCESRSKLNLGTIWHRESNGPSWDYMLLSPMVGSTFHIHLLPRLHPPFTPNQCQACLPEMTLRQQIWNEGSNFFTQCFHVYNWAHWKPWNYWDVIIYCVFHGHQTRSIFLAAYEKTKKKRASSVQAQASEANSTQEWHGKANAAAHQRDDTNLSTRSRRHKF
jgi:hypothetical protein